MHAGPWGRLSRANRPAARPRGRSGKRNSGLLRLPKPMYVGSFAKNWNALEARPMEDLSVELDQVRSHLEREMQLMQSHHADLTSDQWTFEAVSFRASAGDHLIISKRDWEALWRALKTANAHSALEPRG